MCNFINRNSNASFIGSVTENPRVFTAYCSRSFGCVFILKSILFSCSGKKILLPFLVLKKKSNE